MNKMLRPAAIALALAALFVAGMPAKIAADGEIELVTIADVFDGIETSSTVTLAAYSLKSTQQITKRLIAARERGARVSVALGRGAFGSYVAENAATTALLRSHGIEVHETAVTSHVKFAILGGTLYLSDRNFASTRSRGIVVRDAVPGDRELAERAIIGEPRSNDHLFLTKVAALDREAYVIRLRGSRSLSVSTESFDAHSVVYPALLARRATGDAVRLMVAASEYRESPSERRAVAALAAAGIRVRTSTADEKYVVDGDDIWFGSANATAHGPIIDFGIALQDEDLAQHLGEQFEREWAEATPVS